MPNIVLKNRDGVPVEHPTDRVRLMMSDGNQQEFVNASSAPVLVPANIELDFSGGDMEIVPENGKAFSEITVVQPEALRPENIVKNVDIGGVIGTFEGSVISDEGYLVKAVDYDGTALAMSYLSEGDVFQLPGAPEHEGLVFDGWSSPIEVTGNNVIVPNGALTIGATYHTTSGATEIDIVLTKSTGLTFTFLSSRLTGKTSVDWGDGAVDNALTHTYSAHGKYTIKIFGVTKIANGGTSGGVVAVDNISVLAVRLGQSVTSIGNYAFYKCHYLTSVVIPTGVTSIGASAFQSCYSLKSIFIPASVRSVGNTAFNGCYSLTSVVISNGVTTLGTSVFGSCRVLTSIILPASATSIGTTMFNGCFELTSAIILGRISSIGSSMFANCYKLTNANIPSSVTSLGDSAFNSCNLSGSVIIPASVTSIGTATFYLCLGILEFDFTAFSAIPTIGATNPFKGFNPHFRILVPAALYDAWIVAENWSTYANYIVAV